MYSPVFGLKLLVLSQNRAIFKRV
uniref:Uncharacterized protein n=1 Tax=Anguilla anguilla TaxID=7936 RepID=A0A0E9VS02_ANGAN